MIIQPIPYTGTYPKVIKTGPYRDSLAKHRNTLYEACLKAASERASEFYHTDSRTGIVYRHTGASHRCAFWAGYDQAFTGVSNRLLKGAKTSDTETCYRAGLDFGKADMKAIDSLSKL